MSSSRENNEAQGKELQQLREEVHLTSSKLLDLTYNETLYIQKLEDFNAKAKNMIEEDFLEEALVYLGEAERLLQYGASCGKTIDRNLIICTLHNEACCYYKAGEMSTASKYIEAVIFNLKSHLDSVDSSPSSSSQSDRRGRKTQESLSIAAEKKVELVSYYLKYCTINSQAKNRITALDAGKRVIQLLKSLVADLKEPKMTIRQENSNQLEVNEVKRMISGLRLFRDDIVLSQIETYILLARHYVKKWNQNKIIKKISYGLEKHIGNYSISQVIDMVPMQYLGENVQSTVLNSKTLMQQILHFSMGYFTISTQYRLLSEHLYKKPQQRVQSEEYTKARIYHLLSILFLAQHIHCDLLLMSQITSSYQHHYKAAIFQQDGQKIDAEALAANLLYELPKAIEKKQSEINNALLVKIAKMRSKSKDQRHKIHTEYEDTELCQSKVIYQLNDTKTKGKTKRSVSKQLEGHKLKKPAKVLNDSLFQSTKQLQPSRQRSISNAHKGTKTKPRSTSKDSQNIKPIKMPPPVPAPVSTKPVEKLKHTSKRVNDEYQLCKTKVSGKKRSQSISSADLSCSVKELNKTKAGNSEKLEPRKSHKKKVQNRSKQKLLKDNKQVYSKHYYV